MTIRQISIAIAVLVLAGVSACPTWAQITPSVYLLESGSLTAASSACGATNCVAMPVVSGAGTVAIQLAGSFTGTVQFEGSVDSANYVATPGVPVAGGAGVTSATAAGVWQVAAVGLRSVRARCSAFSSGPITATLVRSPAAATAPTVTLASALSVTSLTSAGAVSGTTGTFSAGVTGTVVHGAQSALTSAANSTTFDASVANSFKVTLGENSTLTVSNAVAGQTIHAIVCQDGTGSRTWSWGTVMKGGTTIGSTLSTCTAQSFLCSDSTHCWAVAAAVTGM